MPSLSVVIPALNEVHNIEHVIASVPVAELGRQGWDVEVLVVDNASTDGTGDEARRCGARVVLQPDRGYGNAYKAGFRAATGDVIVTGDADRTYPLDHIPGLLRQMEAEGADFVTTDRLRKENAGAMKPSHVVGNQALSTVSRMLFRNGLRDSQSGMWIFRRRIWDSLDVRSSGMQFSQELKNEAHLRGFRCAEVPIEYRPRGGEVKLNAVRDGWANLRQLFEHRFRGDDGRPPAGRELDVRIPAQRQESPVRGVRAARGLAAVLGVGLLAVPVLAFSSGARHQLSLSTQRVPASYVELAFADQKTARACEAPRGVLRVPVSVRSHLGDADDLTVTTRVTRTGGRTLATRAATVATEPGQESTVPVAVRVPERGAYDVEVALSGRSEQLRLHCGSPA